MSGSGIEPMVHIVDDDEGIRESLKALLSSVGLTARTYTSAKDFLRVATPQMCGCLVVDVRMPEMGGLELQQILNERGIRLPMIVVTGHGDVPMAVRAMKAGAKDFLLKPFNEQELLERIQAYVKNHASAHQQEKARIEAANRFSDLTGREHEVLARLMAGQNGKAIAHDLGISEKTVDVHRFNIMHKASVRSLAELIHLRILAGDLDNA